MRRERWWDRLSVYFDFRDWWIGAFFSDGRTYICPLPVLVIKYTHRRTP